jgi:hypothetical protein
VVLPRAALAVAGACAALAVAEVDLATTEGEAAPPGHGETPASLARAAGCSLRTHRGEGRAHTTRRVRYRTNPPTSGDHDPIASEDGVYASTNPPDVEQSVHALEHGRILLQYRSGTPRFRIAQLERLVDEDVKGAPGYHTLLFRNQTRMPSVVAATAWRVSLTCPRMHRRVFAAVRAFRRAYVDKGPEFIP